MTRFYSQRAATLFAEHAHFEFISLKSAIFNHKEAMRSEIVHVLHAKVALLHSTLISALD